MNKARVIEIQRAVLITPEGKPILMDPANLSPTCWPHAHRYAALLCFRDGQVFTTLEPGVGTLEVVEAVTPQFVELVRQRTKHIDARIRKGWLLDWRASQPPIH
jgi:hypothetical protein